MDMSDGLLHGGSPSSLHHNLLGQGCHRDRVVSRLTPRRWLGIIEILESAWLVAKRPVKEPVDGGFRFNFERQRTENLCLSVTPN